MCVCGPSSSEQQRAGSVGNGNGRTRWPVPWTLRRRNIRDPCKPDRLCRRQPKLTAADENIEPLPFSTCRWSKAKPDGTALCVHPPRERVHATCELTCGGVCETRAGVVVGDGAAVPTRRAWCGQHVAQDGALRREPGEIPVRAPPYSMSQRRERQERSRLHEAAARSQPLSESGLKSSHRWRGR